ncbi:hypothetical protein PKOR_19305 [Pontibacter korlensis]|uniref:Lipoprotein n=2 Tax=Pontibacter korlensis TaxID=400092 RepID=A0A0E3ZIU3_9BACT|nr:hypothetical protein PKOR_19305 [Pontibacter korlensis]
MRSVLAPLVLLFVVALIGCTSNFKLGERKMLQENYKNSFIEGFKTLSFCRCIKYGYDNKYDLVTEDASCRFPDYLYSEVALIDILAKVERDKILLDSASRVGRVAEGMEGKRVMDICLKFYNSSLLDSVAISRYQKDKNQ